MVKATFGMPPLPERQPLRTSIPVPRPTTGRSWSLGLIADNKQQTSANGHRQKDRYVKEVLAHSLISFSTLASARRHSGLGGFLLIQCESFSLVIYFACLQDNKVSISCGIIGVGV